MKKVLVLGFALFFLLFVLLYKGDSYAYTNCEYNKFYPQGVTSLNLPDFLKEITYNELIEFCSYTSCYTVKEGNIKASIENYNKIYYKELTEEDKLVIDVKGFPITEIVINNC